MLVSAIRRLTAAEYEASVAAILQLPAKSAGNALVDGSGSPFNNTYATQVASETLITGLATLAHDNVAALFAKADKGASVLGCVVASPTDEACVHSVATKLGRKFLRRPLRTEEVAGLVALARATASATDLSLGLKNMLEALLQHPEFVYRAELGGPAVNGVARLTPFEVATRLSFLLWGQNPDDALLDAAEKGELMTPASIRAHVARLLKDARAVRHAKAYHAQWLGYAALRFDPVLSNLMRQESDALVEKVVAGQGLWTDLLSAPSTYLPAGFEKHYVADLPLVTPSAGGWVLYPGTARRGILSHASVLSNGAKGEDTSPTNRGLFVLERLMCLEVGAPPPNVAVDDPPDTSGGACKTAFYQKHGSGSCAGCHKTIDGIGFGLEAFDLKGQYRTAEPQNAACKISGDGELVGTGTFKGPGELGTMLASQPRTEACFVKHLVKFATGRSHLTDEDDAFALAVVAHVPAGKLSYSEAMTQFATQDAFGYVRLVP